MGRMGFNIHNPLGLKTRWILTGWIYSVLEQMGLLSVQTVNHLRRLQPAEGVDLLSMKKL